MKAYVDQYEGRIHGVLSCFDRMLFGGYLPIMSGWSMAQLLQAHEIDCGSVKSFLLANAERVKAHAMALAREHDRPFEYVSAKMRKEDAARKIAERDGLDEGLVCVFSALEPCRTFSLRFTTGQPYVQSAKRKCLHLYWPRLLNRYVKQVVPQLDDVLSGCEYYWVAAQAEYSTDVMFKTPEGLRELYPRLLSHSTLCFGATEVMNFLGRKLVASFQGEVVSDLSSLVCRRTGGSRIKHRVKQNWLKMYDKAGLGLRVETVINNPEEFRVRKKVLRDGRQRTEWVAQHDATLFKSLMAGEHCLHGFTNRDIRSRLTGTRWLRACAEDPKKASAKVGRCFRRLHAHGLIAKIARTRRWRVTRYGRNVMGTSLYLREHHFPNIYPTPALA